MKTNRLSGAMSAPSDSTKQSEAKKRSSSLEPGGTSPPKKAARIDDEVFGDIESDSPSLKNGKNTDNAGLCETEKQETESGDQNMPIASCISTPATLDIGDAHPSTSNTSGLGQCSSTSSAQAQTSGDQTATTEAGSGSTHLKGPEPSFPPEQSDWAAMAAAEALASLTRGGEDQDVKDAIHSSKQVEFKRKHAKKTVKQDDSPTPGKGQQTRAAADSSTSSPEDRIKDCCDGSRVETLQGDEEEDEGDNFLSGTTSTPSSSHSDDDNGDDVECSIVDVKMAPETRQSVALLAQVQIRLDALEKKATRMHQHLELKISQQRRPHLDQRSTIIQTIPGFWVTAFLNHPQLSAYIDENDEDALSYMTNLEVEFFKSNKFGYRITFQFSRNNFFQNNIIIKEFHHDMRGSVFSFSNPILWHRGQNLTSQQHIMKEPGSGRSYQSFFCWFSDHNNPSRDEIAVILKDDLYRNPLRYYLTPLWEPRQNGSSGHQTADNNSGNECVVISDSDEEEEEGGPEVNRDEDEEEEDQDTGESSEEDEEVVIDSSGDSEDGEQGEEESSDRDKVDDEDLDVEELDESQESESQEAKEEEEDIEVGREDSIE
ncbi:testis specific protein Y-linked isoform X1 [Brienomyrus brachyistius]|uniref:testis specific protein Y-linked isoform X1 n=2 Tax=Brienomyrus brachyistius TaxID=42636 RepID=UPI0020B25222|nr:testis specific protein Y-linked isoform X1 [Brienomyrus brachyistius]